MVWDQLSVGPRRQSSPNAEPGRPYGHERWEAGGGSASPPFMWGPLAASMVGADTHFDGDTYADTWARYDTYRDIFYFVDVLVNSEK